MPEPLNSLLVTKCNGPTLAGAMSSVFTVANDAQLLCECIVGN